MWHWQIHHKHNSIMNYHVHAHVIIHLTVKDVHVHVLMLNRWEKLWTLSYITCVHVLQFFTQRVVPWYSSLCRNTVLPKHHVPLMTSNTINILSWTGRNIVAYSDTTSGCWKLLAACIHVHVCTYSVYSVNKVDVEHS